MITTEDKFIRFIEKFNCCANQLNVRGYRTGTEHWCLKQSEHKTYSIIQPDNSYYNPLSLALEGHKISNAIYGSRNDYSEYMKGYYPYLQLSRMFSFEQGVLYQGFCQGYQNQPTYNNNFEYDGETSIAFDLGRFFLNKYFGIRLKHTVRSYFK